jgi:hypothetical protein
MDGFDDSGESDDRGIIAKCGAFCILLLAFAQHRERLHWPVAWQVELRLRETARVSRSCPYCRFGAGFLAAQAGAGEATGSGMGEPDCLLRCGNSAPFLEVLTQRPPCFYSQEGHAVLTPRTLANPNHAGCDVDVGAVERDELRCSTARVEKEEDRRTVPTTIAGCQQPTEFLRLECRQDSFVQP